MSAVPTGGPQNLLRAFLAARTLHRIRARRDTAAVNVIVVGCGRVGSGLATALAGAGHDVVVMDRQRSTFAKLPPGFPGRTLAGSGFDRDDLVAAGIETADSLVAVTSGDNTNIVSARVARELFGVRRVVARIYDPRRAEIYERLGIPTVATVRWSIEQVLLRLDDDPTARSWTAPTGDLAIVERTLGDHWAGRRLDELEREGRFRLLAVRRVGATVLADGTTVAQPGDVVCVGVRTEAMEELHELLQLVPSRGGH